MTPEGVPTPVPGRRAAAMLVALSLALAGCADRVVTLRYAPPAAAETLGPTLVVMPFRDVRGNEGDHGDPLRVDGVYGGYGNRLAKVMATAFTVGMATLTLDR